MPIGSDACLLTRVTANLLTGRLEFEGAGYPEIEEADGDLVDKKDEKQKQKKKRRLVPKDYDSLTIIAN